MKTLASERPRYGCPRLHVILKREKLVVNHKRTERIYKEEKLSLRLRKRKKKASGIRVMMPPAEQQNDVWVMDFIHSRLANGRRFKALTIEDECTRVSPGLEVDTSIGGRRVVRKLDEIAQKRGYPKVVRIDNGPEFSGKALDEWAYRHGLKLDFIDRGKPVQNAYIESFNGRFRDECLNQHWFLTLDEARRLIEEWRVDYNEFRPHSSLGGMTPEEYSRKFENAPVAAVI